MTASVNKVILIGNLGKDPEVHSAQGVHSNDPSTKIVVLSVATKDVWKDKSGIKKDRTEWHRVVIFNDRLATVASTYLKKGSKVYIEGQLQNKKWTNDKGVETSRTEIVLPKYRGELGILDKLEYVGGTPYPDAGAPNPNMTNMQTPAPDFSAIDEIPEW